VEIGLKGGVPFLKLFTNTCLKPQTEKGYANASKTHGYERVNGRTATEKYDGPQQSKGTKSSHVIPSIFHLYRLNQDFLYGCRRGEASSVKMAKFRGKRFHFFSVSDGTI
jgi:hypothetical protein